MRTPPGEFPEDPTSAADLAFVAPEALDHSGLACLEILAILVGEPDLLNTAPDGEPSSDAVAYRSAGGAGTAAYRRASHERALLWVLNQADGSSSLLMSPNARGSGST